MEKVIFFFLISIIKIIGLLTFPDGRKYEGQYEEDKKHGVGIF